MRTSKKENLFHFSDLSQEELRNLQLKLVGLLNVFDEFCKENNIKEIYVEASHSLFEKIEEVFKDTIDFFLNK